MSVEVRTKHQCDLKISPGILLCFVFKVHWGDNTDGTGDLLDGTGMRKEKRKLKLKGVKGFVQDHPGTRQAASAALIINE